MTYLQTILALAATEPEPLTIREHFEAGAALKLIRRKLNDQYQTQIKAKLGNVWSIVEPTDA